jgi:hypothetical protein
MYRQNRRFGETEAQFIGIADADLRRCDSAVAQEAARVRVSELLPALDAHTVPVRPGSVVLDWTFYDECTLLIAHDQQWFSPEQAVAVVRLVLGRRINLVQAVAR